MNVNDADRTVVGVVGDVYQVSLETAPITEVYVPMAQFRVLSGELMVHTSGNPYDVLPAVKSAVLQALPDVPIRNVRTMEEVYRTASGAAAAEHAAARPVRAARPRHLRGRHLRRDGLHRLAAHARDRRAHGARRDAVERGRHGDAQRCGLLVAGGLVVGGAGAWCLSRTAEKFLFRLDAKDPRAFAVAIVSLTVAALIASAIPARRAASVDPMEALRAE